MITPLRPSAISADGPLPLSATAQRSLTYQQLRSAFCYPEVKIDLCLAIPDCTEEPGPVFLAAFDPGVSPQACSLHEADHVQAERTALFEELLRFYSFFGLARNPESELPDHLTVELEFLHFLTFLQHQAEQAEQPVDDLLRAQHDFVSRHLLRLTRGIATRFQSGDPHYAALVGVLSQFVEHEFLLLGMTD